MAGRPSDPVPSASPPPFAALADLCSETIGGRVVFATDEWFASADNLLKRRLKGTSVTIREDLTRTRLEVLREAIRRFDLRNVWTEDGTVVVKCGGSRHRIQTMAALQNIQEQPPRWREGVFGARGKWMDGWESRRRRLPGHDWALLRLGVAGVVKGVLLDTAFFTGNFAPRVSLQAACLSPEEEAQVRLPKRRSVDEEGEEEGQVEEQAEALRCAQLLRSQEWTCILPITPLRPGYEDTRFNYFAVASPQTWTHIRLNLYPDGGVARLRVFGEAKMDLLSIRGKKIDLLSVQNGAVCIDYSDAHYGHPNNITKPNLAKDMGDGWETARRLDRPSILTVDENNILQVPGNEWCIFRLGCVGILEKIQVDTSHFKGNYPDSIKIEGTMDEILGASWNLILRPTKLSPHKVHTFPDSLLSTKGPFKFIRVTIAPDGGISRLRLWGEAV